jgi:hypothetical protein
VRLRLIGWNLLKGNFSQVSFSLVVQRKTFLVFWAEIRGNEIFCGNFVTKISKKSKSWRRERSKKFLNLSKVPSKFVHCIFREVFFGALTQVVKGGMFPRWKSCSSWKMIAVFVKEN